MGVAPARKTDLMGGNGKPDDDGQHTDPADARESTLAMESPQIPEGVPLPTGEAPPSAGRPLPRPPVAGRPLRPPGVAMPSARAHSAPRATGAGRPPAANLKATRVGLGTPGMPFAPGRPVPAAPAPAPAKSPSPSSPEPTATPSREDITTGKFGNVVIDVSHEDEEIDDAPTMASEPGAFADIAARYAAERAARASSTSEASPAGDPDRPSGDEVATVAVPRDVLDRVRSDPKAVLAEEEAAKRAATTVAGDDDDDEIVEETRAMDLGAQKHVVIGAGAAADDATLAVPQSANEAAKNIGMGISEVLGQQPGAFGAGPGFASPSQPMPSAAPGIPGMGMPPTGPHPMPGQPQQRHWSSGNLPAAGPPQGAGAPYNAAMMQPGAAQPPQWAQQPGQPPANTPKKVMSGQLILLLVVGFVCLAIFLTGVVLFATTNF